MKFPTEVFVGILEEQRIKNTLLRETIDLQREELTRRYEHNTKMFEIFGESNNQIQVGWIDILARNPGENQGYIYRTIEGTRSDVTYSFSTCIEFFDNIVGRSVNVSKIGEAYRIYMETEVTMEELERRAKETKSVPKISGGPMPNEI